jgi:sugar fermentation stimulation protein A
MHFERPLLEGRLVRRYKRFLADIELPGRGEIVAHCPNPGSMATCAAEGGRVWVSESDNPTRKLRYTWELADTGGAMVMIHTGRANTIAVEGIEAGVVAELRGYQRLRREVKCGKRSRIDVLLERGDERCYVEIKSVTLGLGGQVSAFPDAVTARGKRHLEELIRIVETGDRGVLLFCCGRDPSREVRPADHIDPAYGEALRRALAAGVEVLAYRCEVSPAGVWLRERVPLVIPRLRSRGLGVPGRLS